MTKRRIPRFCSLAIGIVLLAALASTTQAQTEGIPVALVAGAIHDYRGSFAGSAQEDREWNPRRAFIRPRLNSYTLLAAGVYTASFLDMTETQSSLPHFKEQDPLARPLLLLPPPLYYASGAMLATGVNWLGLRWQRSPRLHKIWWLPQLVSIGANLSGFEYTRINTITLPIPTNRGKRK